MGYVIAVAGKGGTGKTTVSALIVRLLKEKRLGSVLAIDADPNSNLAETLGCEPGKSIGSILDEISAHPQDIPSGMSKDRFIDYQVQTIIMEEEGFDLLTMGKPEGPGCYCYVNNCLRGVLTKVIGDYDYVVIDNEAGLEHLARKTARFTDALIIVSDATQIGLKTVRNIEGLVKQLDIKTGKRFLLINRLTGELNQEKLSGFESESLGFLPFEEEVLKASQNGSSLMEKKSIKCFDLLNKMGEKIWQRSKS